jgi:L-alanine-DL-glutamate epimerase-like enolase superfamily enzyme
MIRARAYRIPTSSPESDGTFEWDATTLVVVEVEAGGGTGLGYTYGDAAAARLAAGLEIGDPFDDNWSRMLRQVRNLGRPGVAAMAISAVDVALWDLRAKLLKVPLAKLLGCARRRVPVYGSGGFTSYSEGQLVEQLGGWVAGGIGRVKMKVGRDPAADCRRVALVKQAIGAAELFVDANGAYDAKLALAQASAFDGVTWFEEPVSSDDLDGLAWLRRRVPMRVAAGEYGFDPWYFRRMLEARAVDVLQADATRCCGITGFLQAAALADAFFVPLSPHCAPSLHLHAACAVRRLEALEYFHDHARIEQLLFDGARRPADGMLEPDWSRPGLGLTFKRRDAERYAVDP